MSFRFDVDQGKTSVATMTLGYCFAAGARTPFKYPAASSPRVCPAIIASRLRKGYDGLVGKRFSPRTRHLERRCDNDQSRQH